DSLIVYNPHSGYIGDGIGSITIWPRNQGVLGKRHVDSFYDL
ncbi:unnamed protein product, partial [marine sediment metagenome]